MSNVRAALSQSEHQGDEGHPMQWGCTCHGVNDYPVTVVPVSSLPLRQPPTPALSDEARKRLGEIAGHIESAIRSYVGPSDHLDRDLRFLRNLSSREQGGAAQKRHEDLGHSASESFTRCPDPGCQTEAFNARTEPPAGEAERLREAVEYAEGQLRPGVSIGKTPEWNVEAAHARLEAALDPPPSDSQEDDDA